MQLQTLSESMIGSRKRPDLKTKTTETGVLIGWARDLCSRCADKLQPGEELEAAGAALHGWKKHSNRQPTRDPQAHAGQVAGGQPSAQRANETSW
eukprot:356875-Pyramimonas_sp.AAC.1